MTNWTPEVQPFGANHAPLLTGWASDGSGPVPVSVDKATGALLIEGSSGGLSPAPTAGQAKIAVTSTAVQLANHTLQNGVIVTALSTNAASITVGGLGVTNTVDGTGNGYILAAGASISFAVTNTNDLYVNGTSGDIISFAGS